MHGISREGSPYDALDPGLLLWVHATLVDSALLTYRRFVAPLSDPEQERYYEEMKEQATVLRVPVEVIPATLADFRGYVDEVIPKLEVSDDALSLRDGVLSPDVPLVFRPASAWLRAITISLLPLRVREGFGLKLSRAQKKTADTSAAAFRGALPLLPRRVRYWPHAREAARRTAAPARP